jgi:hypothetical protein
MRRVVILLTLTLGGGPLVTCGKDDRPARSTATAPVTNATTRGPLDKQRALAFARAVNLTAADVPGFTVSSSSKSKTPVEARAERQMLRCAGSVGSHDDLAEVGSEDFELKHGILNLSVDSEVGVARTSAIAASRLAAIRGAHLRACFSQYLDRLFKSQEFAGAIVSPVSIQSGTPPALGTTGSFGWRVTASFSLRRLRVPFYLDLLGFVDGPAQVTLLSFGLLRPFPAAIQQQLFSLLLRRAKAHRL